MMNPLGGGATGGGRGGAGRGAGYNPNQYQQPQQQQQQQQQPRLSFQQQSQQMYQQQMHQQQQQQIAGMNQQPSLTTQQQQHQPSQPQPQPQPQPGMMAPMPNQSTSANMLGQNTAPIAVAVPVQQQQQQQLQAPTAQYQQPNMMTSPQGQQMQRQDPQLTQNQQIHMQQQQQQQQQQFPLPPNQGGQMQAGQMQQPNGNVQENVPEGEAPTTSAATNIQNKLKGFFSQPKDPNAPNFGFKPTASLAQRHEDALISSKRPLFQFQVTKLRTWRTGYARLLCLYDDHFSTIDPDSHNITNTWNYNVLTDFVAVEKDQLLLQVTTDKLKFQCHNVDRSRVLSALLQCQDQHSQSPSQTQTQSQPPQQHPIVLCNRWTRHGTQDPSALKLTPYGLVEVHPTTKRSIQTYLFVDVVAVSFTSDDATGLVLHFHDPLRATRLFSTTTKARTEVASWMKQAYERVGLELSMAASTTVTQWRQQRQMLQQPQRISSATATEWQVSKPSRRHDAAVVGSSNGWAGGLVSRALCITGTGLLLEKDAAGKIVSQRSLSDLYAIVRPATAGNVLVLEYTNGQSRQYTSSTRDSLLVSLLDAASTLGKNPKVQVSDVSSGGYCLASFAKNSDAATKKTGGLFQPISIPQHCLKRVHGVATAAFSYLNSNTESSLQEGVPLNPMEECRNVMELCREFNASVLPTAEGLPTGEKDKYVLGSVGALWGLVAELLETKKGDRRPLAEQTAAPMFQTLHRLSKTPAGYRHSIELATFIDCLPLLWTIEDSFCKFWAFRTLTVVLSGPPATSQRDKEVEYVNKSVVFKAGGPRLIHGLVSALLKDRVSDLIRMVMSDILQSVLCSYADTTSPEHFAGFIQALGENYPALLQTLYQQTPFVIENSALLLHLLSTHAPNVAASIREAALSSAILLHHFHAAMFSPLEGQRFLSRFLCSLWLAGPMNCDEKKLLCRIVPRGFMQYLKMPALSRGEEEQLDSLERDAVEENIPEDNAGNDGDDAAAMSTPESLLANSNPSGAAGTNTARLRSRIGLARATAARDPQQQQTQQNPENFRIFFHVLTQNHALPDLIWNQQTRRELRIGLESEIQLIQRETEARGIDKIAWNHQQFGIEYPSLDHELRVGSVYMRLWLQAGDGFIKTWEEPVRLFELLFRRFLCEMDRNPKVTIMCIRCLERLYAIHGSTIGPFPDVMILIRSMAATRSIETQHRLLGLLATILGVQDSQVSSEVDGNVNVGGVGGGATSDSGKEITTPRVNIPENAEQLLNTESIEQLCQYVAWGHTNGVQVGNLMTSVLGKSTAHHSGLAMLTDGRSTDPRGDTSTTTTTTTATNGDDLDQQPEAAPDAACPPVWFVASTGRIPPPAEAIRGPYRVSELKRMMDSGDISPFTLVTSTHVENYEEDGDDVDDTANLKEAQIDTGKWKRMDQVWQLRWQLCTDGSGMGIFTPSEVALRAVNSLTRLVDLHKSLDSRGIPYYPIPIAKRIMCGLSRDPLLFKGGKTTDGGVAVASSSGQQMDSFLSILAQSLLCNDHKLVDQAADLLHKLTQYNEEATSKFYLTGVFFFICCYTGSNFAKFAKLLQATHLEQHFRSGFAAAADNSELPLKERSILGSMLPEGVLYVLVNYGVERFTEVFVGNYDTPEVIWNFQMRKHLIEMIQQHLGDFPNRLWQNTTTDYQYCPMPGVAYQRLKNEIFCHNYYLNNLCDEVRFPDWPISEPVEVFRSCLEHFKKQMSRDEEEEGEALERACKVLDLKADDGSKEMRKSYRSLARKYHPDKNPAGREMFEAIQEAYELLLPIVESGQSIGHLVQNGTDVAPEGSHGQGSNPNNIAEGFVGGTLQMETMQVLIKTQSLICRRFEADMSKYKYPAYSILLSCLTLPESCRVARSDADPVTIFKSCMMTKKRAEFVRDSVELVFRTCLVSPLNAEELVAENGVPILESLLDFYVHAAHCLDHRTGRPGEDSVTDTIVAEILTNVVHTIAGVAYYENGRKAIASLPNLSQFCVNWRRCIEGRYLGSQIERVGDSLVKKFALEGVGNMARNVELQSRLIGSGVVWPLGRFLLGFDPTLDEGIISRDSLDDDVGISQAASNTQARLSARALGMLCGCLQDPALSTPKNVHLQRALNCILTRPIAVLLRNKRTGEILRTLNTNVETPARIWNVEMRREMIMLLDRAEKERPEGKTRDVVEELSFVSNFGYKVLKDELKIGGIYVRVFNRQGMEKGGFRGLENPSSFAKHLVDYVARCINDSSAVPRGWIRLAVTEKTSSIDNETDEPEETAVDADDDGDVVDVDEVVVPSVGITDQRFILVISALRILARVDGLIDDVLCAKSTNVPSVILSLLELPQESEAFEIGCDILVILSPKQRFADSVASQGALWRLLWVLERSDTDDTTGNREDSTSQGAEGHKDILRKQRGWMLLESLSSSPSIALKLVESTAWLELLGILVGYSGFTKIWIARTGSAKTLSRLLWDPKTGPIIAPLLQRFLPSTLVIVLKEEGPETMLNLFDRESDTPELIWDSSMRTELRRVIAKQLDECVRNRSEVGLGDDNFTLDGNVFVKYKNLEDELFVGGVYVSRFLKEPTYNLRDPTKFLEMLLLRWSHELTLCTSQTTPTEENTTTTDLVVGSQDALQLVTNASVYLCKVRSNLCDKLSQWGYMSRCLSFLESVLKNELLGTPLLSVMRLLHVAANRRINVDAIIASGQNDRVQGIVTFSIQSVGEENLHPDSVFIVEMLKKVFVNALGDVKSGKTNVLRTNHKGNVPWHQSMGQTARAYAMAPSPAPGEGRVSRNRVTMGNPLDDPLAMGSPPPPQQQQLPPHAMATNAGAPMYGNQYGNSYGTQQRGTGGTFQASPHSMNQPILQFVTQQDQGFAMRGAQTANTQQPVSSGFMGRTNAPAANQFHQPYQNQSLQHQQPQQHQQRHQPNAFNHGIPAAPQMQQYQAQQQRGQYAQQTMPSMMPQQSPQPARPSAGVMGMPSYQQNPTTTYGRQAQAPSQTQYVGQPAPSPVQPNPVTSGGHSTFRQNFNNGNPLGRPVQVQQQQQQQFQQNASLSFAGRPTQTAARAPSAFGAKIAQQTTANAQIPSRQPTGSSTVPYGQGPLQTSQVSGYNGPGNLTPGYPQTAQPSIQQQVTPNNFASPLSQGHIGRQPSAGHPTTNVPNFQSFGAPSAQTPQAPSNLPPQMNQGSSVIDATTSQNLQGGPAQGMPHTVLGQQEPVQPTTVVDESENEIDARTKPDPKEEAERRARNSPGAPNSADGRVALLQSALLCNLPNFLVDSVLENPSLSKVKDPAALKVHAVELLKLLTLDPGYGMKFSLLLDELPNWKKYKAQDHSLFITGHEQKADYFLTAGPTESTKMLTQGPPLE